LLKVFLDYFANWKIYWDNMSEMRNDLSLTLFICLTRKFGPIPLIWLESVRLAIKRLEGENKVSINIMKEQDVLASSFYGDFVLWWVYYIG
jgi:hypothetical protein